MRRKRLNANFEFRIMWKKKGRHVDHPQVHIGSMWDHTSDYFAMSDSAVVELRDWLSRYINEHIRKTSASEVLKASRVHAHRVMKNMDKLESKI